MDLFDHAAQSGTSVPLAERMRPKRIEDFLGQESLLAPGRALRRAIAEDRLFSMLFWGPPGSGKTTLARIIAESTQSRFVSYSAVGVGVKEIKALAVRAAEDLKYSARRTILFLDEIHRFNRSQQDYLLPNVESGIILLIGATTENPSFEVNAALLSRLRVFILEPLSPDMIKTILLRAIQDKERGIGIEDLTIDEDALEYLAQICGGDARTAFNILEPASFEAARRDLRVDLALLMELVQERRILYDKSGEQHFNLISALHKSLRDSDPDAGVYWLGRMLEGGEDPLYIARRLVRFASEDIGLASPRALEQAVAGYQACRFIGMPECSVNLAQVVVFLAAAPKSNSLEAAYIAVKEEIQRSGSLPVPLHLRNAPTRFMKKVGYGKGYKYAHDFEDALVDQEHLPEELRGSRFYDPGDRGYERDVRNWLEQRKEAIEAARRGEPAANDE